MTGHRVGVRSGIDAAVGATGELELALQSERSRTAQSLRWLRGGAQAAKRTTAMMYARLRLDDGRPVAVSRRLDGVPAGPEQQTSVVIPHAAPTVHTTQTTNPGSERL